MCFLNITYYRVYIQNEISCGSWWYLNQARDSLRAVESMFVKMVESCFAFLLIVVDSEKNTRRASLVWSTGSVLIFVNWTILKGGLFQGSLYQYPARVFFAVLLLSKSSRMALNFIQQMQYWAHLYTALSLPFRYLRFSFENEVTL